MSDFWLDTSFTFILLCVRTVKPSLVAYVISTIISWAGSMTIIIPKFQFQRCSTLSLKFSFLLWFSSTNFKILIQHVKYHNTYCTIQAGQVRECVLPVTVLVLILSYLQPWEQFPLRSESQMALYPCTLRFWYSIPPPLQGSCQWLIPYCLLEYWCGVLQVSRYLSKSWWYKEPCHEKTSYVTCEQ